MDVVRVLMSVNGRCPCLDVCQCEYVTDKLVTESEEILVYFNMFYFIFFYFMRSVVI